MLPPHRRHARAGRPGGRARRRRDEDRVPGDADAARCPGGPSGSSASTTPSRSSGPTARSSRCTRAATTRSPAGWSRPRSRSPTCATSCPARLIVFGCPADEIPAPLTVEIGGGKAVVGGGRALGRDRRRALRAPRVRGHGVPAVALDAARPRVRHRRAVARRASPRRRSTRSLAAIEAVKKLPPADAIVEHVRLEGDVEEGGGLSGEHPLPARSDEEARPRRARRTAARGAAGRDLDERPGRRRAAPERRGDGGGQGRVLALGRHFVDDPGRLPFGTDFGNVSQRVPAALIGIGRPGGWAFHTDEGAEAVRAGRRGVRALDRPGAGARVGTAAAAAVKQRHARRSVPARRDALVRRRALVGLSAELLGRDSGADAAASRHPRRHAPRRRADAGGRLPPRRARRDRAGTLRARGRADRGRHAGGLARGRRGLRGGRRARSRERARRLRARAHGRRRGVRRGRAADRDRRAHGQPVSLQVRLRRRPADAARPPRGELRRCPRAQAAADLHGLGLLPLHAGLLPRPLRRGGRALQAGQHRPRRHLRGRDAAGRPHRVRGVQGALRRPAARVPQPRRFRPGGRRGRGLCLRRGDRRAQLDERHRRAHRERTDRAGRRDAGDAARRRHRRPPRAADRDVAARRGGLEDAGAAERADRRQARLPDRDRRRRPLDRETARGRDQAGADLRSSGRRPARDRLAARRRQRHCVGAPPSRTASGSS